MIAHPRENPYVFYEEYYEEGDEDDEDGKEISYQIVGEDEADAKQGLLSVTSPVARALMSREVGDEVSVKVPKGVREFEVLEIRFEAL